MKLIALDQIHVSSVKADSLRPREGFEIADAAGEELLKAHPGRFERGKAEADPANKAEDAPANKAEAPSANKATTAPANKSRKRAAKK